MAPGIGESLRWLFAGRAPRTATKQAPVEPVSYKGYMIRPEPREEGSQWLTAGVITKEAGGMLKEHRFVRGDLHGDRTSAAEYSISKGQQIIDLDGDRIFE